MQYLTVTALSMLQQQAQRQLEKMSVKTSICPLPSPTFHHSTVECRPAELNRFESIFFGVNRIKIIFGELECTIQHPAFIICSWFMLIVLFLQILSVYIYLVSLT